MDPKGGNVIANTASNQAEADSTTNKEIVDGKSDCFGFVEQSERDISNCESKDNTGNKKKTHINENSDEETCGRGVRMADPVIVERFVGLRLNEDSSQRRNYGPRNHDSIKNSKQER